MVLACQPEMYRKINLGNFGTVELCGKPISADEPKQLVLMDGEMGEIQLQQPDESQIFADERAYFQLGADNKIVFTMNTLENYFASPKGLKGLEGFLNPNQALPLDNPLDWIQYFTDQGFTREWCMPAFLDSHTPKENLSISGECAFSDLASLVERLLTPKQRVQLAHQFSDKLAQLVRAIEDDSVAAIEFRTLNNPRVLEFTRAQEAARLLGFYVKDIEENFRVYAKRFDQVYKDIAAQMGELDRLYKEVSQMTADFQQVAGCFSASPAEHNKQGLTWFVNANCYNRIQDHVATHDYAQVRELVRQMAGITSQLSTQYPGYTRALRGDFYEVQAGKRASYRFEDTELFDQVTKLFQQPWVRKDAGFQCVGYDCEDEAIFFWDRQKNQQPEERPVASVH